MFVLLLLWHRPALGGGGLRRLGEQELKVKLDQLHPLLYPEIYLRQRRPIVRKNTTCDRRRAMLEGEQGVTRTRKRLLNIHHLPRTRLHEPALALPRPLQALRTLDLARALQVALVPRDDLDGRHAAVVQPLLRLHVDHVHEVVEGVERVGVRDVVHQQKGVGAQVRRRP